jgi:hypothetical protein
MKKLINLGSCEVSFDYGYKSSIVVDKITGDVKPVHAPISTKCVVVFAGINGEGRVSCSHKDHFEYERGRKLSMRKAFAQLPMSKEDKKRAWSEYNKLKPGGRW